MQMYKYNKSGPTGGETFTVTCFTCGMPSSKEWAQLVQSRPCSPDLSVPFYPFLLQATPPSGALFSENGTTYLCAFCHALLESQWNAYQGKKEPISPLQRKYVIHKFICAVCGVETYRKRVRALPFQEFPFLAKTRQPGSITLGNNPLAVVCLDCSETLWAQSAEYDRWGLPVHKRHFNWMARPPPPEDSVDSAVARLPSGETQLPRCPPTDPLVPPKTNEPTAQPEAIPPIKYTRPRANSVISLPRGGEGGGSQLSQQIVQQAKYCHQQQQSQSHRQGTSPLALTRGPQTSPRKITHSYAESSAASSSEMNPHVQPPIVTVAPMSLQHSVPEGGRNKNSVIYTLSHIEDRSSPHTKYVISSSSSPSYGRTSGGHHPESSHHQHSQFPHHMVPYYSPPGPSWPPPHPHTANSDDDVSEYNGDQDSGVAGRRYHSATGPVTWRQRESPTTLHHYPQVYTSPNISHHHERMPDSNFSSPPSLLGHPLSLAALFPQLRLQQSTTPPSSAVRSDSPACRRLPSPRDYEIYRASPSRIGSLVGDHYHHPRSRSHSPSPSIPTKRQGRPHVSHDVTEFSNDLSHNSSEEDESTVGRIIKNAHSNPIRTSLSPAEANVHIDPLVSDFHRSVQHRSSPFIDVLDRSGESSSADGDEITDDSHRSRSEGEYRQVSRSVRRDFLHPKKRHWEPSSVISSSSSAAETPSVDNKSPTTNTNPSETRSVLAKKRKFSMNYNDRQETTGNDFFDEESTFSLKTFSANSYKHGAMDLSMPQSTQQSESCSNNRPLSSTSKFSIAYLCKSETAGDEEGESCVRLPLSVERSVVSAAIHDDGCETNVVVRDAMKKSSISSASSHSDHKADNPTAIVPLLNSPQPSLLSLKKISIDESVSFADKSTRKTTEHFMTREEEGQPALTEIRTKQSNFLGQLGLVTPTPNEKTGLEIKSMYARNLRGPEPLKLKDMCLARIPNGMEVSSKASTLEVNTTQVLFLRTLGLCPRTVTEKLRRENNADAICSHQIAPASSPSSSHCDLRMVQSSDNYYDVDDETGQSKGLVNPICIKYPKYIPGDNRQPDNPQYECTGADLDGGGTEGVGTALLRIPVVRKQINFNMSESEDEEASTNSEGGGSKLIRNRKPSLSEIKNFENSLQASEYHWKESKELLTKAMNETKSSSSSLDEQLVRLQAIRNFIKMQQSDLQGTEASIVELEKQTFHKVENT